MKRLHVGAPLAVMGVLVACAQLKDLPERSVEYLKERGSKNVTTVGDNAITAVEHGDLGRSATFSMEQEFRLGKSIAANVLTRLGAHALDPEHPVARYLRDVGAVVALAAAERGAPEDRPYPMKGYRFIVVEAAQVNAVGMPGGFVAVTTGALRAARSEDELAAIVAHEIAHVQRGHAMSPVERARQQEHMTSTLLAGTDDVVHVFFSKVVTLGADFVLDKGCGKANELAADAFAAQILEDAGYDPGALSRFLSRLQGRAAEGGFFSSHPPASERLAALGERPRAATASDGEVRRLARFEAQVRDLP